MNTGLAAIPNTAQCPRVSQGEARPRHQGALPSVPRTRNDPEPGGRSRGTGMPHPLSPGSSLPAGEARGSFREGRRPPGTASGPPSGGRTGRSWPPSTDPYVHQPWPTGTSGLVTPVRKGKTGFGEVSSRRGGSGTEGHPPRPARPRPGQASRVSPSQPGRAPDQAQTQAHLRDQGAGADKQGRVEGHPHGKLWGPRERPSTRSRRLEMLRKAEIPSGLENLGQFASFPNMPHDSPQALPSSQLGGRGGQRQTQPGLPLASQRAPSQSCPPPAR